MDIRKKKHEKEASHKTANWKDRSRNRAVWEKSIKEEKIHIRMSCYLRSRKGRKRRRSAKVYIDV